MKFHFPARELLRLVPLLLLGTSGCMEAQSARPLSEVASPATGGTFRICQVTPQIIDPAQIGDTYEATLINQIFDGLLSFDANFSTLPGLAQSWIINDEGREYIFQLREGVRFHDGSEVTAHDVAYSIERIFRLPEAQTGLAREYLGRIKGTEAFVAGEVDSLPGLAVMGKYEVCIKLDGPYASFLAVLASELARVVPRHYVEAVGDEVFARAPIGSGPFKVVNFEPGGKVELEAYDDYYEGRAFLDSLIITPPAADILDHALELFRQGELSAVELTPGASLVVASQPGIDVYSRQELSLFYAAFNCSRKPFNDRRVRRAFALAVNHDALGTSIDQRTRPTGILPPGMPGYTPGSKLPAPDLAEAARLLTAAGYPGGKGLEGLRFISPRRGEDEMTLHRNVADQVREAGFSIELSYHDWVEFDDLLEAGEFDAYNLAWIADIPDPDSFLYPLFHSRGSNNYGNYANIEVDRLLAAGRSGDIKQGRLEIYRTAERLLLQDIAVLPMHYSVANIAVQPEVHGFNVTSMGMGNLPLRLVWMNDSSTGVN